MGGRAGGEEAEPGWGEDGVGVPAVGRVGFPADELAPLQVLAGFSDSLASAWYSRKLSLASCCSWHSSAHRSLCIAALKARQVSCCSLSSHRGDSAVAVRLRVTGEDYHLTVQVKWL